MSTFFLCNLTGIETLQAAIANTVFFFFFFILLQQVRLWIVYHFKVILKRNHSFLLKMNQFFAYKTQVDKF